MLQLPEFAKKSGSQISVPKTDIEQSLQSGGFSSNPKFVDFLIRNYGLTYSHQAERKLILSIGLFAPGRPLPFLLKPKQISGSLLVRKRFPFDDIDGVEYQESKKLIEGVIGIFAPIGLLLYGDSEFHCFWYLFAGEKPLIGVVDQDLWEIDVFDDLTSVLLWKSREKIVF